MRNPEAGGAELHLHEILTRLVAKGHRATLFATRFPGATEFDSYDGIDVVRHGSWYNANFTLPGVVASYVARERADLVLEDINKIPFLMPLRTQVPVMPIIPHLFGSTVFRETNPLFATYVYLWELLIPRVYRDCRFAVISPSTKTDLVRRGVPEKHVDVVLCGLDHSRYRVLEHMDRYEEPTIVHFGRLRKYKGVEIVLRTYAKIRRRISDARLIVIGDGPDLPRLKNVASSIGIDDGVRFTGRVPIGELVEILNRSHLFINASPKEGWGLTVVEANACGVPVIGSNRPGLMDSILHEKTGYLVEYGDVDAMAERAIAVLSDPVLWTRLSAAGMEWAGSMTWERCADEMEKLFLREAGR